MMYDAFKLSSLLNVVVGITAALDNVISLRTCMFTIYKIWFPNTLPVNRLNFFLSEQDSLRRYPRM